MKVVMLDRDGVLNQDRADYVKHPGELVMIPGAGDACALLNRAGIKIAVVSNQSVVGRGIISVDMLERINDKLRNELQAQGGRIDLFLTCTEPPGGRSERRKPAPGMLREVLAHFRMSPRRRGDDRRSNDRPAGRTGRRRNTHSGSDRERRGFAGSGTSARHFAGQDS